MAECSISELIADACENQFSCVQDERMFRALVLQLLCNLTDGGGGGGATQQIYSTTAADPNVAAITPEDPTKGAIFYQDPPSNLNEWKWSVTEQEWQQTSG